MTFSIEVKKYDIREIIEDIKEVNNYLLPSYQRNFVWDDDDIVALLDSIKNGYPIGNVILWKKPENVDPLEVDPFAKPLYGNIKDSASSTYFVIDGQQRLTALLLIFNEWKIMRGDEIIERGPISYDYVHDKFRKGESIGIDVSKIIKAFYYNDLQVAVELAKMSDSIKEKISDIARSVINYPLPIYEIKTSDAGIETAERLVEAFIRINKQGQRISNLELILSYTAGIVGGEAKNNIMRMYEEARKELMLDLQPIIRYSLSVVGMKQTDVTNIRRLKSKIDRYRNRIVEFLVDRFKDLREGLMATIKLMKFFGITSSVILPSQLPITVLASFFYHNRISSESVIESLSSSEIEDILNWLLLVNFTAYYTSRTNTKLERDLLTVSDMSKFSLEKLATNIEMFGGKTKINSSDIERGMRVDLTKKEGRPYVFLLYLLLVKNGADDWNGYSIRSKKWEKLSKHHIFPKEYLKRNIERLDVEDLEEEIKLINNLGNITLIDKNRNSEIGDKPPSLYLSQMQNFVLTRILKAHMIPEDRNLWNIEHYYDFLRERIKLIKKYTSLHFSKIN